MPTISGRMANLASRYTPGLGRRMTKSHVERYRSSDGKKGASFRGMDVFLLDVVGRTSGEPRPVMLMLARRDEDLVVVGSNAGNVDTPNWYKNLMAAGGGEVQVGAERWAVDAREVDGDEKAECWQIACAAYPDFASYQELTDRNIPVAVLSRRSA
ncbi:MAG: nitroreductase family deazaflavin-dependent oxidoreductase [Actinomycetota bacterium]